MKGDPGAKRQGSTLGDSPYSKSQIMGPSSSPSPSVAGSKFQWTAPPTVRIIETRKGKDCTEPRITSTSWKRSIKRNTGQISKKQLLELTEGDFKENIIDIFTEVREIIESTRQKEVMKKNQVELLENKNIQNKGK